MKTKAIEQMVEYLETEKELRGDKNATYKIFTLILSKAHTLQSQDEATARPTDISKDDVTFEGKRKDTGEIVQGSYVRLDFHDSRDYVEADQIVLLNGHTFDVEPDSVRVLIADKPTPPPHADKLVEALEKLARLGNGTEYGNSDGNRIAQEALAKYKMMNTEVEK